MNSQGYHNDCYSVFSMSPPFDTNKRYQSHRCRFICLGDAAGARWCNQCACIIFALLFPNVSIFKSPFWRHVSMPIMNSYSVVVVDRCVDTNLLRRSAYKVLYTGNVDHVISSTIKITEKAFCLSSHYMVYIQSSRPFSIYMKIYSLLYSIYMKIYRPLYLIYIIFTGSFIRFTWCL